ncbi:mannose-1-phosphate guanylyltransferase [uncultured Serinicoccus sp.]|uniref:mannose-1-phosphate guanylyltransferase n=1 Tax=uncultured Serinicoccus sp. TaxID=735514 RepID=UPI0026291EE8|nr:mannose-1-phosphate guanylyltransferase [uncultured Serinicoccus sp.]
MPGDHLADFTAVIPAGGTGTRLWPLSRAQRPKYLLDLAGTGQSMLRDTVDRVRPLVGAEVMVVTGRQHADLVASEVDDADRRPLVVEPSPRNSMPAIGLAAAMLERENPDAVLGAFPADHVVDDVATFHACVRAAHEAAGHGYLVTLGISPTRAATGFGYIEVGPPLELPGATEVRQVGAFREKPAADLAAAYLRGGRHLWNAGIFVVGATVLLDLLAASDPEMARVLRDIARHPDSLESHWAEMPSIAIDHAVVEPAARDRRVAVVPAECGWDDVGDFASLAVRASPHGAHPSVRVLGDSDTVMAPGSTGFIAPHGDRMVVSLGLQEVIAVDTPDALLLTTPDRAQEVGSVVELLRGMGREDLI